MDKKLKEAIEEIESLSSSESAIKIILQELENLISKRIIKEKIEEDDDVYEEYRKRLLCSNASILKLEIYETFAGTGFIDNTLDLVELLQFDNDVILNELKEIRKNICNNIEKRYTDIERLGYMSIVNGYIVRLQEERRRLNKV